MPLAMATCHACLPACLLGMQSVSVAYSEPCIQGKARASELAFEQVYADISGLQPLSTCRL